MERKAFTSLLGLVLFLVSFSAGNAWVAGSLYRVAGSKVLGEATGCKNSGSCQNNQDCCSGRCQELPFVLRVASGSRGTCQPRATITPTPPRPTWAPVPSICPNCQGLQQRLNELKDIDCDPFREELKNLAQRVAEYCSLLLPTTTAVPLTTE